MDVGAWESEALPLPRPAWRTPFSLLGGSCCPHGALELLCHTEGSTCLVWVGGGGVGMGAGLGQGNASIHGVKTAVDQSSGSSWPGTRPWGVGGAGGAGCGVQGGLDGGGGRGVSMGLDRGPPPWRGSPWSGPRGTTCLLRGATLWVDGAGEDPRTWYAVGSRGPCYCRVRPGTHCGCGRGSETIAGRRGASPGPRRHGPCGPRVAMVPFVPWWGTFPAHDMTVCPLCHKPCVYA